MVVLDRQGGLTHDSAELARVLGEDRPVPAGTKLIDVAVLIDRDEVEALLGRALGPEGSVVAAELGSRVDSDRPRWFSVRMVGLTEDPDVAGVVVTVHEVTDRILAQREIAHNALHDGPTGLANRALFDDRLDQALRRAEPIVPATGPSSSTSTWTGSRTSTTATVTPPATSCSRRPRRASSPQSGRGTRSPGSAGTSSRSCSGRGGRPLRPTR